MKATCPTCQKEINWTESRYRPFCSERCKLIDLGRWASGDYRIPVHPEDEEGNDASDQSEEKGAQSKDGSDQGENGRPSS